MMSDSRFEGDSQVLLALQWFSTLDCSRVTQRVLLQQIAWPTHKAAFSRSWGRLRNLHSFPSFNKYLLSKYHELGIKIWKFVIKRFIPHISGSLYSRVTDITKQINYKNNYNYNYSC